MKIAVMGFSGSGKSTLSAQLAEHYGIDVFHFDRIQFLPDWKVRPLEEKILLTEQFLDTHDSWVMDGTYSKLSYERRLEEADEIVLLRFGRLSCLRRVIKRYNKYKNTSRPDIADGCNEKLDFEFIIWVLFKGRNAGKKFDEIEKKYASKVTVIKNQRELDAYKKKKL